MHRIYDGIRLAKQVFQGNTIKNSFAVSICITSCVFSMNQDLEQRWFKYIDELNLAEKKTAGIKRYIHSILSRNGIVILDTRHLSALIGIDNEVLNRMIIHPEKYYRCFSIPKRKGGFREISSPYPTLMKVQKWIYQEILLPSIQLEEVVTGFVKKKSILDNASPHVGHSFVLKMDIKDFFPSVTINRVISVFKALGYHHRLSYALASLCCYNGSLPQGAPTSPILSNTIAKRMDRRIQGFAKTVGLSYTRYADDITLSGEYIDISYAWLIERIIVTEGFSPNREKTRLLGPKNKKIITGVSISSNKATIPRQLKRDLRQQAYYINKYGLKGHIRHERIKDPVYPLRLQGYFAFWRVVEPVNASVRYWFKSIQDAIRNPKNKWWKSFI